ncbi:hypothetical protein [Lysobacter sp.]|uniref:hypothetical protein n=1 Tax=Lysobacter sp. TaxID=72226 RepID=UPI002D51DEAB|nr:hypothetical protein [Lysobacter sp.]HZX79057.1 hypothetical protein [Lysobacter sp.]
MDSLLDTLSDDELRFIAERDYGVDCDAHLAELLKLIREQSGVLSDEQFWHPYEVIELCAHALEPGHEREFAACTLVVINAVATGYDTSTRLDWKFNDRADDYDRLPSELRELILAAYAATGLEFGDPF